MADLTAAMYARLNCEIQLLRARKEIAEKEDQ